MLQDLKYAFRQLAKSPLFTVVAVLSLALGIGANATVLCWLRHLVSHPLPGVRDQERLVVVASNQGGGNVSTLDLQDFVDLSHVFVGAVVSQLTSASLTVDQQQEWTETQVVSADFFTLLGVQPIRGRTFLPGEDRQPGGNPVLVISERLWRRRFASAPDIVGRTVDLNRHAFTIVGVVPDTFHGTVPPLSFDAWAPRSMLWEVCNQRLDGRSARGWHNIARLQPGVSVAQAAAAVASLDAQLALSYPDTNRDIHHRVLPLSQCPWGAQALMGPVLTLLLGVSAGVLLIVAANVANLLLARATARQKEIAIRLAAGASRARLLRQFFTESLLLALLGGAFGVLFASWAVDCLPHFLAIPAFNLYLEFPLDATTLGLTLLLTLVTGLIFGLAPALQASRPDLNAVLKEGGRSSSAGAAHHRLRGALVVVEIALALVLLIGAGLCLKGLDRARRVDFGFVPDHVLTAGLQIGMNGYTPETGPAFYRQTRARLAALPGVEEAAFASWFPLGLAGCKGNGVRVDGYVRPPGEDTTYEYAIVSPRYFAALRIPFVAGRDFTDQDDASAPDVAIVNQAFAQHFWPGQDVLGRKFRCGGRWRTIIGVTPTGKYNRLSEAPHWFFYLPYQQGVPDLDLNICLRTTGDAAAFGPALRQAVSAIDPAVELVKTRTLTVHVESMFFTQRMATTLLATLGAVALMLAAMGVYAVMAYSVSQRMQEFGVRMALGALPGTILRQVLLQGLGLAAAGIATGLTLALAVTRLMAGFLYGVSPLDPVTFVGVPLLLTLVALLACLLPARRATRINPVDAMRAE